MLAMIPVRSMISLRLLESEIQTFARFVEIQSEKFSVSAWMTHYLMFVVSSRLNAACKKSGNTWPHEIAQKPQKR